MDNSTETSQESTKTSQESIGSPLDERFISVTSSPSSSHPLRSALRKMSSPPPISSPPMPHKKVSFSVTESAPRLKKPFARPVTKSANSLSSIKSKGSKKPSLGSYLPSTEWSYPFIMNIMSNPWTATFAITGLVLMLAGIIALSIALSNPALITLAFGATVTAIGVEVVSGMMISVGALSTGYAFFMRKKQNLKNMDFVDEELPLGLDW